MTAGGGRGDSVILGKNFSSHVWMGRIRLKNVRRKVNWERHPENGDSHATVGGLSLGKEKSRKARIRTWQDIFWELLAFRVAILVNFCFNDHNISTVDVVKWTGKRSTTRQRPYVLFKRAKYNGKLGKDEGLSLCMILGACLVTSRSTD